MEELRRSMLSELVVKNPRGSWQNPVYIPSRVSNRMDFRSMHAWAGRLCRYISCCSYLIGFENHDFFSCFEWWRCVHFCDRVLTKGHISPEVKGLLLFRLLFRVLFCAPLMQETPVHGRNGQPLFPPILYLRCHGMAPVRLAIIRTA